ncbi:hypothetical protein GCM10022270_04520 [Terriglobus aquaticus]
MHNTPEQIARDRNVLRERASGSNFGSQPRLERPVLHGNVDRVHPPTNFHFPYWVSRPTPYQACDENGREHFCGGVLQADQVVWLQQPLHEAKASRRVMAFTPSAGLIRLESRRLAGIRRPV